MPKLVYVHGLLGPEAQIWYEKQTNGIGRTKQFLAEFDITEAESLCAICVLEKLYPYGEKIIIKDTSSNLERNVLPRSAKKLNMEFDENYRHMTKQERDEFLDTLYPALTEAKT